MRDRTPGACLNDAAQLWPTPSARDWRDGRCGEETAGKNSRPLNEFAVTLWATPRASDGEKGGPNQSFGAGGVPLPTQTVAFSLSLPAPPTSPPGPTSSGAARSLNPLFVEWLMGWPIGWTGSEVPATELSLYRRRMHGAFFALLSRIEAQPGGKQQAFLFAETDVKGD